MRIDTGMIRASIRVMPPAVGALPTIAYGQVEAGLPLLSTPGASKLPWKFTRVSMLGTEGPKGCVSRPKPFTLEARSRTCVPKDFRLGACASIQRCLPTRKLASTWLEGPAAKAVVVAAIKTKPHKAAQRLDRLISCFP